MESTSAIAYISVALLAIVSAIVLLPIVKSLTMVTIIAASVAASAFMIYARFDLGYWDKFAIVAFVVSWVYAFVVSFVFLGIGRLLKWPYFLPKK